MHFISSGTPYLIICKSICSFAYLDFKDEGSLNKALELDGSKLNNQSLSVDEAKPKGDFGSGRGGGRSGGWSGGRDGSGRGGRGGRGGRDGGGRGGRRGGGGRFGGGRGGRGTPYNKPNLAAAGTGIIILLQHVLLFLVFKIL